MAVEMGAKTAYMQPNQEVLDYVSARAVRPFEVVTSDPDFVYAESHVFDVSAMEPVVSCPHDVDNVHPISEVAAKKIALNQAYIGSCTNGRTEDIVQAAAILKGKHIPKYSRLLIVPASKDVMQECMEKGYLQDLIAAGATLVSPGCAACLGTHEGVIAPGEVCITCTNRNFKGRMGSNQAEIYLGSPATVAASILNGYITDPRPYLD
jgi:3-isopropylmalate/(R)-2-methylmalate dehydratase large subunit